MALNIKNAEVERLVEEISRLTGESKTEAVRRALEERKGRLAFRVAQALGDPRSRLAYREYKLRHRGDYQCAVRSDSNGGLQFESILDAPTAARATSSRGKLATGRWNESPHRFTRSGVVGMERSVGARDDQRVAEHHRRRPLARALNSGLGCPEHLTGN